MGQSTEAAPAEACQVFFALHSFLLISLSLILNSSFHVNFCTFQHLLSVVALLCSHYRPPGLYALNKSPSSLLEGCKMLVVTKSGSNPSWQTTVPSSGHAS